jgi:3-mercaptopyruvate sulfurtransferase SseA
MYKQIFTLIALTILLGLGTRVIQDSPVPFWGFPQPIKLIQPKGAIAETTALSSSNEAFVPADKPYAVDYMTVMGLFSKQKRDSIHFVDARDPALYAAGHIPGSVNIPFELLGEYLTKLNEIPKNQLIVFYCDGGDCRLSHDLAEYALTQGWNRLSVFEGGWAEWSKESDLVATGKDEK